MRARVMGGLMIAGGVLGGVLVALPPAAPGSDRMVLVVSVASILAGIGLLITRRRIPEWGLGLMLGFGTALVSVAIYSDRYDNRPDADDSEMLYVWICLYAFYFFHFKHALVQLVIVAITYAAILLTDQFSVGAALAPWLITVGTLAIGGLIVSRLRGSLRELIGELTDRARVDSLTGLLNRDGLEERATVELARSARDGNPLALLVIDVDDFKTINDNLGHPAGDQVLCRVASVLERETRDIDAVARVGGDEFTVLMPGSGLADAMTTAERLRISIRRSGSEAHLRLGVSVGVAVGPEAGDSLERLWKSADRAMYEGKRSGGDAVSDFVRQPPAPTITPWAHEVS